MTQELTTSEATTLSQCEATIERGLATFYEVGAALMAIRDGRLYKQSHASFGLYCKERWRMTPQHANRLIASCETRKELEPVGSKLPASERHSRPLTLVPKEERAEVWQRAVESAPESGITATHVQQTVDEWAAENEPDEEPEPDDEPEVCDGIVVGSLEELAGVKFGCIYADPPWQYGNQSTRAATDNHYDTMTVDELCAMPVADYAADDAHLHLWTTNAFLPDSFRLMEAWGFEYRSCYVWVKPQMGIGNYWRVSHEFLLLGIRGNAKRFLNHSQPSWGQFDRTKHSAKPEEIRQILEYVSPGPFLEMFGRRRVSGWTVMGNQVESRLFA